MIARIVLPSIFDMIDNVDETNKTVGKNLRYLVEKRWDDSQEELARRLGVHQTHVSAMLRGAKLPSLTLARKIAIVLDSNVDFIVGLTDDDKPFGDLADQVVVTIDDPDRRAKVQAVAESMRRMPDGDITLVAQLVARIAATTDDLAATRKIEIEENDRLWTSVFMLAGARETQRLLDAGIPASDHFRRMIKIAVAREQEASNQRA